MKIFLAVVAALLATGRGLAWASIPDSGGTIHGCYDAKGALRVIDTSTTSCKNNETGHTWSQTGPRGATGPEGPAGPPGVTGVFTDETIVTMDCSTAYPAGETLHGTSDCPTGELVVGGGASVDDLTTGQPIPQLVLVASDRPDLSSWAATAEFTEALDSTDDVRLTIHSIRLAT